jgi:KipI family sensor histidine kinase inhibitor
VGRASHTDQAEGLLMLIPSRAPHPISDHTEAMQLRSVGPHAVLIEVSDFRQAHHIAAWVRQHCVGVREVVPAATTVLVDGVEDPDHLARQLSRADTPGSADGGDSLSGPQITIPVTYSGPDLSDIARAWGMEIADVVRRHTSINFVAAFCGFSPGFTYLEGLPAGLAVSRLTTPRTRVPVGSVAIADRWCAVYPSDSPGGWRILGTTSVSLWSQSSAQPALIPPGARVRFEDIT